MFIFNGNIVLIPQFVYKVLGTNDPVFHHSLGDFDYGLRGMKKNIQSLIAPGILGECDRHEALPSWCNPQKTLSQRWNAFHSPLGCNPKEFFILNFVIMDFESILSLYDYSYKVIVSSIMEN